MTQTSTHDTPFDYTGYAENGYAELGTAATPSEIAEVEDYIEQRIADRHEGNIFDGNGRLRALHGYDPESGMLSGMMTRCADITKGILECERVYVYQFRVNVKNGTGGAERTFGSWKPHRDFDYWYNLDGMAEPRAVIFHMLVNEHHARNGPLEICLGSHRRRLEDGVLHIAPESDWKAGFSEDIKYQIDPVCFAEAKPVPVYGPAGTLLAMHPLLWHASAPNITEEPRILLSVIFNDLSNAVAAAGRPSFIVQSPDLGTW